MMFANPNICFIWDERLGIWRHTTADRIIDAPKRYAERVDILTRNFR